MSRTVVAPTVAAVPTTPTFFLGLALVAIGTGFFKVNASTMVGQLYQPGDPRRDAGFTIFYMGVNVGALIGQIACGYLGESPRWGWHYGFGTEVAALPRGSKVEIDAIAYKPE